MGGWMDAYILWNSTHLAINSSHMASVMPVYANMPIWEVIIAQSFLEPAASSSDRRSARMFEMRSAIEAHLRQKIVKNERTIYIHIHI